MTSGGLTRDDVIRLAWGLKRQGMAADPSSSRYDSSDRELSWSLDTLGMCDVADDECYSPDGGSFALRFGRFTLYCDGQGFRTGVEHATEAMAVFAMAELREVWEGGDDE